MNTPKYVFERKQIEINYKCIKEQLGGIRVYYALKANSEKPVMKVLKEINADFEVASNGEFDVLREIGVLPSRIICGLPIKTIACINYHYKYGCRYFVFDMSDELNKLIGHAPLAKKILRLNINDLIPGSLEYGMPFSEIMGNINNNPLFLEQISGLSFHISNNIDISNFNKVIKRVEVLLAKFPDKMLTLNIGGGYRIYATDQYFDNLNSQLNRLRNKYKVEIIAEPGSTVVNTAGVVQTTVVAVRKRSVDQYDVYIDAGEPCGIKTDGERIPSYIKLLGKKEISNERMYRFIDITCMHSPLFSVKLSNKVKEGDVFEFGDMGAYTTCLRNNFHRWESPGIEII